MATHSAPAGSSQDALDEEEERKAPGNRRQLTATNLQSIPDADELAPGIRLGPQGNQEYRHKTRNSSEGAEEDLDHARQATQEEEEQEAGAGGRRTSIMTSSSDAGGHVQGHDGLGAPSGPPSVMGSVGPSASLRASGVGRSRLNNSVGHFGSRGEAVAGVPPELDPRASNFRPPSPSAASIYSVSVQAPASPKPVENEAEDYTLHSSDLPEEDEADPEEEEDAMVPAMAGLEINDASPSASAIPTPSFSTLSAAGSSYPPTPGSMTGIASGIPSSTLDQIRSNPRGLVYSPSGGTFPVAVGASTSAAGLALGSRTDAPSIAATAGSEYPASVPSSVSSRPASLRGEMLHPPSPLLGASRGASSSVHSGSSDAVDDDEDAEDSPAGPATSFAGTSVGSSHHSRDRAATAVPSIAPSEAGSRASDSEFAMPPAEYASADDFLAPRAPPFTATGPASGSRQLPLSFAPGLAAFRSANQPASRSGSTAATAGTSSPAHSVGSTLDHRGRRGSSSSIGTVGSSAVPSESGIGGLNSRRMSRQLSGQGPDVDALIAEDEKSVS